MTTHFENKMLHVEVQLKQTNLSKDFLKTRLEPVLKKYITTKTPVVNEAFAIEQNILSENIDELQFVESVFIDFDETVKKEKNIEYQLQHLMFHYYVPNLRPMEMEILENDGDGDGESVPTSNHWLLPSSIFIGLWENLIYEEGLKEQLLNFALSALAFSQHKVNHNIITCNRLILLHGPPGTGKTSLCKALAQKVAIRSRNTYRQTHLIEINSHSLFSKWFSESGKLVMRLFSKIHELVMDSKSLVCVLIDEVESLAFARDAMSSEEPKDAMRVVNALLTQLDNIREYPNVLILATSNLAKTIDDAFIDRADIKQYIGVPSKAAVEKINASVLTELMRAGILVKEELYPKFGEMLNSLTALCYGLSGRSLRKLPFLAHALHFARVDIGCSGNLQLTDFLNAMMVAVKKLQCDEKTLKK